MSVKTPRPPRQPRTCRHCVDFTPSSRPWVWGECSSVEAKHGVYRQVVEQFAVRADFGCVHWRERPSQ